MLQTIGSVSGAVSSGRPLSRLSVMTSQALPKLAFQPGYFSSSHVAAFGRDAGGGIPPQGRTPEPQAHLIGVVLVVELGDHLVPVPGQVEAEIDQRALELADDPLAA